MTNIILCGWTTAQFRSSLIVLTSVAGDERSDTSGLSRYIGANEAGRKSWDASASASTNNGKEGNFSIVITVAATIDLLSTTVPVTIEDLMYLVSTTVPVYFYSCGSTLYSPSIQSESIGFSIDYISPVTSTIPINCDQNSGHQDWISL
ncbi:hypothetical protein MLD38_018843 [Melastoma candidum]|uniref:Uncharacterized protein n=1 Tax=Melastoma candidum TaxID=119954 RepID=A0ACB9R3C1_9MYRT|nr:hypothetical protein MLD38_018843 [Melastoma candidum]